MFSYIKALYLNACLRMRVLLAAVNPFAGDITPVGRLYATRVSPSGLRTPLGLICTKVVTTAGVNYLVQSLAANGANPAGVFNFHGSGTGVTAEAVGQTALVTEVATRATGSQGVGAGANIYRTVGTVTYAAAFAITEHAVFSASTAGTMLDRSVFAAINVASADSIEFTYDLTLPAGS